MKTGSDLRLIGRLRMQARPYWGHVGIITAFDALAAPLALLTSGDEATQRSKVARLDIADRFVECVFSPINVFVIVFRIPNFVTCCLNSVVRVI